MPRAFSDADRERIRQRLREAGRESFATLGLRRTAVDDLVRAAGISKGAFYLFYDSKEELLQEILEQSVGTLYTTVLERVLGPGMTPRQSLRDLLRFTISARQADPLLRHITPEEMDLLSRRVPSERAEQLRQADLTAVTRWLYHWRARGVALAFETAVLTGVMRLLVHASQHETEIGPQVYSRALEAVVDSFVGSAVADAATRDEELATGEARQQQPVERRRSLLSRLGGG
jgi:AcrR family transcriptional regulator